MENVPNTGSVPQPFSQHPKLPAMRRTLQVVWAIMVASMAWVSWIFSMVPAIQIEAFRLMQAIGVLFVVLSFALPALIWNAIKPANETFEKRAGRVMAVTVIRFALSEAALILFLVSSPVRDQRSLLTYFGAFLGIMILHFPRADRIEELFK